MFDHSRNLREVLSKEEHCFVLRVWHNDRVEYFTLISEKEKAANDLWDGSAAVDEAFK